MLLRKPEGMRSLERRRHSLEDNIKLNNEEIEFKNMSHVHLSEASKQWRTYSVTVISFRISLHEG
jgi:hypothetical protein